MNEEVPFCGSRDRSKRWRERTRSRARNGKNELIARGLSRITNPLWKVCAGPAKREDDDIYVHLNETNSRRPRERARVVTALIAAF